MKILTLFLLITFALTHASERKCDEVLNSIEFSTTDELWAYLSDLLKEQIITTQELEVFYQGLLLNMLINPVGHMDSIYGPLFERTELAIHYKQIQKFITANLKNNGLIDLVALKKKVAEELNVRGSTKVNRDEVQEKSKNPFIKMSSLLVKPGTVMMGHERDIQTNITRPFELMSTHVTQYQWYKIMNATPSKHNHGPEQIEVLINGEKIKIQPNHPVETISWNDVQKFIKKLNELSLADDPILHELFEGHTPGDLYEVPTEAQFCLAMSYAKTLDGDSVDQMILRSDFESLESYAWFYDNSEYKTHPVAELNPLYIHGKAIYDLHGNVSSWARDSYYELQGGNDPVSTDYDGTRNLHVTKGGSFSMVGRLLLSPNRNLQYRPYEGKEPGLGLRLLRISGSKP